MPPSKRSQQERLELAIAIFIAVASITSALAAWRISTVASSAANASRQGMIFALKKEAGFNEDLRRLYEEAGYARDYAIYLAGIQALEASTDENATLLARNMRDYVLPVLQSPAEPLVSDYQNPDGSFNLEKRLNDLNQEDSDIFGLDPQSEFERAARFSAERRSLVIGTVIIVLSLFWLGLAQVSKGGMHGSYFLIGTAVYLIGLLWFIGIEFNFIMGF
jgi:hypothetical protein